MFVQVKVSKVLILTHNHGTDLNVIPARGSWKCMPRTIENDIILLLTDNNWDSET